MNVHFASVPLNGKRKIIYDKCTFAYLVNVEKSLETFLVFLSFYQKISKFPLKNLTLNVILARLLKHINFFDCACCNRNFPSHSPITFQSAAKRFSYEFSCLLVSYMTKNVCLVTLNTKTESFWGQKTWGNSLRQCLSGYPRVFKEPRNDWSIPWLHSLKSCQWVSPRRWILACIVKRALENKKNLKKRKKNKASSSQSLSPLSYHCFPLLLSCLPSFFSHVSSVV